MKKEKTNNKRKEWRAAGINFLKKAKGWGKEIKKMEQKEWKINRRWKDGRRERKKEQMNDDRERKTERRNNEDRRKTNRKKDEVNKQKKDRGEENDAKKEGKKVRKNKIQCNLM